MMHWMWYNGWQRGWTGILMCLMMIIFCGGVVVAGFLLLRSLLRPQNHKQETGDALEILKQRYAKGEISDEEFDRMKDKLKSSYQFPKKK